MPNMGWADNIKTVTDLLAEINKAESNVEQKKTTAALRKILREMERQQKKATRDLVITSIITSIVAFLIGYFLKYNF